MGAFRNLFAKVKSEKSKPIVPPTDFESSAVNWPATKRRFDEINLVPETGKRCNVLRLRVIISVLIVTGLAGFFGYGFILKHRLTVKEQHLKELNTAVEGSAAAADGSASGRGIPVIEAQTEPMARLNHGREYWFKTLMLLNSAYSPRCYLTGLKQTKTGVSLRGTCQSYADLASFLAFIEQQQLFSQIEILNSSIGPDGSEVNFEILGLWPVLMRVGEDAPDASP